MESSFSALCVLVGVIGANPSWDEVKCSHCVLSPHGFLSPNFFSSPRCLLEESKWPSPVWGIWARWLSLMEDDNDGFKKWPPLLSPGQNPSACIFQPVWPLLKDPWAKCCIFINQLSLMGWKELWKEQRGSPAESRSNSFPGEPQGFFFLPYPDF